MRRAWLPLPLLGAALLALPVPACHHDSVVERELGGLSVGCLVNSDCSAPLVCAFERCHAECVTTRDCDGTLRCVGAREKDRVCQLEQEASCKTTADCAPTFVCGSDGSCRDTCQRDDECIGEQVCVKGTCAEPTELDDDGQLPQVLSYETCRLSSDCPLGSRCEAGVCLPECLTERDCAAGSSCVEGACVAQVTDTCLGDDDCLTTGQHCEASVCRCECRENIDCDSGASCDGCACVPPPPPECVVGSDCESGYCVDGACDCACVENRDCAAGNTCDGCSCIAPERPTVVLDAVLTDAADILMMAGIVEVQERLTLKGMSITTTSGLEGLKTVGQLDISSVTGFPHEPDAPNPLLGLGGLTLIRGDLNIVSTSGLKQLELNPNLVVGGNLTINFTELSCETIGAFVNDLTDSGFDGDITAQYNGDCNGVCVAGACQVL